MHSSITPAEAAKLPHKTLKVPGRENEFLIELEVFHQVHCLDAIRKTIYAPAVDRYRSEFQDFLTPDGRLDFKTAGADHLSAYFSPKIETHGVLIIIILGHCLDWILQALLCQADVTPVHWDWDTVLHQPEPQLPPSKFCRNIDAIMDWADKRDVGPVDFGFGLDIQKR